MLTQLDNVGLQLALAFSNDGTTLAAGGEVLASFTYIKLKRSCLLTLMTNFSNKSKKMTYGNYLHSLITIIHFVQGMFFIEIKIQAIVFSFFIQTITNV